MLGEFSQAKHGNRGHHGVMDDQQNAPIEEGSQESTNEERVQGVVAQVRADLNVGHTHEQVLVMLRERFSQSGIEASDERAEELAAAILHS